jgi:hypothetical protein
MTDQPDDWLAAQREAQWLRDGSGDPSCLGSQLKGTTSEGGNRTGALTV